MYRGGLESVIAISYLTRNCTYKLCRKWAVTTKLGHRLVTTPNRLLFALQRKHLTMLFRNEVTSNMKCPTYHFVSNTSFVTPVFTSLEKMPVFPSKPSHDFVHTSIWIRTFRPLHSLPSESVSETSVVRFLSCQPTDASRIPATAILS